MRCAAINPVTLGDTLAGRHVDATMSTGQHFFGGRLPPRGSVFSTTRLTLRPNPPDHRQERKQEQVFHRLPRKQKACGESASLYFTTLQLARITDPEKQKATPKDG
jgi:hypothetical protein